MSELLNNYRKFRWFFTSSGKLVMGGKNSKQNDELLKEAKNLRRNMVVLHTEQPGSPFVVILSEILKVKKEDLEEAAIFTACFSKAWKLGKKESEVHIFDIQSLYKSKDMKEGTWGLVGNIKKVKVPLRLVLTIQEKTLRAVPPNAAKSQDKINIKLKPGKIDKDKLALKIKSISGIEFDQRELLSAVPSGGFTITL